MFSLAEFLKELLLYARSLDRTIKRTNEAFILDQDELLPLGADAVFCFRVVHRELIVYGLPIYPVIRDSICIYLITKRAHISSTILENSSTREAPCIFEIDQNGSSWKFWPTYTFIQLFLGCLQELVFTFFLFLMQGACEFGSRVNKVGICATVSTLTLHLMRNGGHKASKSTSFILNS